MKLLPAVDLLGGKAVVLTGGDPGTAQVVSSNPIKLAQRWAARGADLIHVVDLDAALGRGENRDLLKRMIDDVGASFQIGGGIRDEELVAEFLDLQAERVVVGSRAVEDPRWVQNISRRYGPRMVVALDARGRSVASRGWTADSHRDLLELAKSMEPLDLAGVLYTNIDVEGKLQGVNPELVRALRAVVTKELIASGGVTTLKDLESLRDAGADAVVVGKALYAGTLDFEEARETVR